MTNNDLYFKFNGFVFNDAFIITSIDKTLIPAKVYNTINIPTVDGERLNGVKYSPLVYTINILIEGVNEEERNANKRVLRDLLNVKHEVQVAFNTRTYGYGMVTSEVKIVNRTATQATATFQLTCFTPFFYNNQMSLFNDTNSIIEVINNGGQKTKPFISVGFTKDAHFCQVENRRTGEKILVGNYPSVSTTQTYKEKETIAYHNCESTTGWTQSSASINADRTTGGSITLAKDGNGLILGSVPSGSTLWKGACYRYNLPQSCEEFTVSANLSFYTSGTNGDPTNKQYKLDDETITTGSKREYYEVTASSLNVRSGPGTNYSIRWAVSNGFQIFGGTVVNGWLKFTMHDNPDCYCSMNYLTKKIQDNTVTTTLQNWVVTNKLGAALCSSPKWGKNNDHSTQLARIPLGEVVRLITSSKTVETYTSSDGTTKTRDWYKLYIPWNGKNGYVTAGDCTPANAAVIEYDETQILDTADDKTGLIELYGFDTSGAKLFSMVMADWNKYYECVVPRCEVGNTTILGTNGAEVPAPKTVTEANKTSNSTGFSTRYILSGKYGDWNDMWCTFTVSRRTQNNKQVWSANIQKKDTGVITKELKVSNKSSDSYPDGQLAYLVLYIGTTDSLDKCADMALTDLIVYKHNKPESQEYKGIHFEAFDILDIDFDNRQVYINEQPANHLLDIGSRFFDVDTGITDIKIISDDGNAVSSAVIREKWVGDE